VREIQLYIDGTKADLFKGDNITINENLKNLKDLSKVFTAFTYQFTLPASRTNNKIFKHYYNYNITDGFDARIRVDANIEISNLPYKKGRIALNSVELKNNKPYSYKVTFFGKTVVLKDLIGDDYLHELSDLDLDLEYDQTRLLGVLTQDPSIQTGDYAGFTIPLITPEQRIFYDTNQTVENSGNIYHDSTTKQGVKLLQLKYAVSLSKLITAIENEYTGVEFASDSFFKDSNEDVQKLYMWCHRNAKGTKLVSGGGYSVEMDTANSTNILGIPSRGSLSNGDVSVAQTATFTPIINIASGSRGKIVDVLVKKNNVVVTEYKGIPTTIGLTIEAVSAVASDVLSIEINTYEEDITFSQLGFSTTYTDGQGVATDTFSVFNSTYNASFFFNPKDNLPKMKVIEFLSGLFRMFNLVAYVQDDGKIQVTPLQEYYSSDVIDINKYVDSDSHEVAVALPFKEIDFEYNGSETILAKQHFEEVSTNKFRWGEVEYKAADGVNIDGDVFKLELPFSHMKFERLIDAYDFSNVTGITWGYSVDREEKPIKEKPLLFFVENVTAGFIISYIDRTGHTGYNGNINIPLNSQTKTSTKNIHFNAEFNEFSEYDADPATDTPAGVDTLFKRFYQSYIENIFDKKSRLIKLELVLPLTQLTQIKLYHKILYKDKYFRINSMKASLRDGKTTLELINSYD
jgi:hypothetical protein